MTQIDNTGERILLEKETPLMIARHLSAYRFSKDYILGRSVLDIGCGEGYGSFYLASVAESVKALDYDNAVIDYAKDKYQKDNLRFYTMDVNNLSSLNDRFDVVTSFQVIEHIRDPDGFLKNIKNLLKENGVFICSTPNKRDASPCRDTPLNKFHVKEYLCDEFKELLGRSFRAVDLFGLRRGRRLNLYRRLKKIGILNFLPSPINPVNKFYGQISCNEFVITKHGLDTALDFIAISKK